MKRRKRKPVDTDIQIIRKCAALLDKSSSPRMARANLEFLYGCYNYKLRNGMRLSKP